MTPSASTRADATNRRARPTARGPPPAAPPSARLLRAQRRRAVRRVEVEARELPQRQPRRRALVALGRRDLAGRVGPPGVEISPVLLCRDGGCTVRGTGDDETLDGELQLGWSADRAGGAPAAPCVAPATTRRSTATPAAGAASAAPAARTRLWRARRAIGRRCCGPSSSGRGERRGRARGELRRGRGGWTRRGHGRCVPLSVAPGAGRGLALDTGSIRALDAVLKPGVPGSRSTRLPTHQQTGPTGRCKSMFAPPNNRPRAKLRRPCLTPAALPTPASRTRRRRLVAVGALGGSHATVDARGGRRGGRATVDYKRQEQRVQLDKFQRDLKERLRRGEAKRAAEVEQFLLSRSTSGR